MPSHDEIFFPARADRADWDFVLEEFPFPLALTYQRLLEVMDRQEPVAAIWAVRDAWEAALKFTASLALADLLNERAETAMLQKVALLLLKPSGLSAGDWHSLLTLALEPLAPLAAADRLADSGHLLPELYPVFFQTARQLTGKPKPTPLNLRIDGAKENYVHWRNQVIGHGVFKQERALYAQDVQTWLTYLYGFYDMLRPVFQEWRLVGETPGAEEIIWQGTSSGVPDAAGSTPHRHQPWGTPLPMFFERRAGGEVRRLPFGPLLSIQQCTICQQPAAFFFDKHQIEKDKKEVKEDKHTTDFLEYFWGASRRLKNWPEARQYSSYLPSDFHWERTSSTSSELDQALDPVLHRFDREYVAPQYLLARIAHLVQAQDRGYIHLVAAEGFGKTYFVRGLDKEDGRVLVHHIQPGALADYQIFLTEINNQARRSDKLGIVTLDAQVNEKTLEAAQGQFGGYLRELARKSGDGPLIIAIDGLDELPDPERNSAAITDLLPPADQLPPNLFFLLTSRETLRPAIREDLERLRAQSGPLFITLSVTGQDPDNQELLRVYLRERLPEPFRSEADVEEVLRLSQGIFLYAFHQCNALEESAFPDVASLPEAGQFYTAYLGRLRAQVDSALFQEVYLKTLLLLSAARQPVSSQQLRQWGVPKDKLDAALYDLRSFLRFHRALTWQDTLSDDDSEGPFYEMAHEAFVRFVERDPVLAPQLRAAHEAIARHALAAHGATWEDADPTETAALYDLRYLLPHLEQAEMTADAQALLSNEYYAYACLKAGEVAVSAAHYFLTIAFYDLFIRICLSPALQGRPELAQGLAGAYDRKGLALGQLKNPAAALKEYDHAIEIYEPLVEQARPELADNLARLYNNKGGALADLGRQVDAIKEYDHAISVFRPLLDQGGPEMTIILVNFLVNKGFALSELGRQVDAIKEYDHAIEIYEPLVEQARPEMADTLTRLYNNKGLALSLLKNPAAALKEYDHAIAICEPLVEQGRLVLANILASAYNNRGLALSELGRQVDAIKEHDHAITVYRPLAEQGGPELANILATFYRNKGNGLNDLGRLEEAVDEYDHAIAILKPLADQGRPELAQGLAGAYSRKGLALGQLKNPAAALKEYDHAIEIYEPLVEQARPELADTLASNYNNKGGALAALGRPVDAIKEYDHAIAIYEPLVEQGRPELATGLARVQKNKGKALADLGRLEEAVDEYNHAIAILKPLADQGKPDLANVSVPKPKAKHRRKHGIVRVLKSILTKPLVDAEIGALEIGDLRSTLVDALTMTLMSKANAVDRLERPSAALGEYDKAIAIYKPLVAQGYTEPANGLADTYNKRGNALIALNDISAALGEFEKAITLYKSLVDQGKSELVNDLAAVLMNKGTALTVLNNPLAALREYDQAIAILKPLVDQGKSESANGLADIYHSKGNALRDMDEPSAALGEYEKAFTLYKSLVDQGKPVLAVRLADTHFDKGNALSDLGRQVDAIGEYDHAIAIFIPLVDQGGPEPAKYLADTYYNKGNALSALNESLAALGEYERAIGLYQLLMGQGRPEPGDSLATILVDKGNTLRVLGRLEEAQEACDAGISLLMEPDRAHLLPLLIKSLQVRFVLSLDQKQWDKAASDVVTAINCVQVASQQGRAAEPLVEAFAGMIGYISGLSAYQRRHLNSALGDEWAAFVRQYRERLG